LVDFVDFDSLVELDQWVESFLVDLADDFPDFEDRLLFDLDDLDDV
jgi:hypothetical protein